MYIGMIERIFPKARIIHCHRNQGDVELACYFDNSGGSKTWDTDIIAIKCYIKAEFRLMAHWRKSGGIPILSVSYAELMSDTMVQIQKILKFIGLEYDDKCTDINLNLERKVNPYKPQLSILNAD